MPAVETVVAHPRPELMDSASASQALVVLSLLSPFKLAYFERFQKAHIAIDRFHLNRTVTKSDDLET